MKFFPDWSCDKYYRILRILIKSFFEFADGARERRYKVYSGIFENWSKLEGKEFQLLSGIEKDGDFAFFAFENVDNKFWLIFFEFVESDLQVFSF